MFRFTLRDMFWLVLLVAVVITWWRESMKYTSDERAAEAQMYQSNSQAASASDQRDAANQDRRDSELHYVAEGWQAFGDPDKYEFGLDKEQTHSGSASAYIQHKNFGANQIIINNLSLGHAILGQSFRADGFRGKRLRLSAYMKTENWVTTNSAGKQFPNPGWLCLEFDTGARGNPVKNTALSFGGQTPIDAPNEWQRYEAVADVPDDATNIFIGADVRGGTNGRIWFADFQLNVVGDEMPLARPRFVRRAQQRSWDPNNLQPVPYLQPRPLNLDFEH